MTNDKIDGLLTRFDDYKTTFTKEAAGRLKRILEQLESTKLKSTESVIRFHELLLFVRAHPHNSEILRLSERLLGSFSNRIDLLKRSGSDLTAFDYIEYSGIAGTAVTGHFSYDVASWLVSRFHRAVDVDWSRHERKERLGSTLPRFLPLLEEESLVEANIPYLTWIGSAKPPRKNELQFLIENFASLPLSETEKAELYDSLELWLRWELGSSNASRTRNMGAVSRTFYHRGPMIQRRDVDLQKELSPQIHAEQLSEREGLAAIDMLRATTTVRYRELYGITHGDSRSVVRVDAGRGVEIFLWGLPPERRLPLRAYHLGFTLKNGVPINYIEGISLCGKMEVGFNTFYTFRDGESAWVYAQVLRVLRHAGAAECFSIDPYQLGFHNEEAIESGAFWFYRKLGFHLTRPDLAKLLEREERKISSGRGYRTGAAILRKLSEANIVYEVDSGRRGEWDRFQVRNLGLKVQMRMAREFNGDASAVREKSSRDVAASLKIQRKKLNKMQRHAFENLALVLALIPDLDGWDEEDKRSIYSIVRAKAGGDEARYSKLLQAHRRLRPAIIKLASDGGR